MIEKPTSDELENAYAVLDRFSKLDITTIQNLTQLLEIVPSVGRQLFTLLRQFGEESKVAAAFDLQYGPILTFYKALGEGKIGLSGRDGGIQFNKWDKRKEIESDFTDPDLLTILLSSVSMEVPTLRPFVVSAFVHRPDDDAPDEEVFPAKYPDYAEEQQKYAGYLQELLGDLMSVLRSGHDI